MNLDQRQKQLLWMGVAAAAGGAMAFLARRSLRAGWRALRHDDPPVNPVSPDVSWGDAVAWSAASGVFMGLAHLVGRRSAAAGWERWLGERPPGL